MITKNSIFKNLAALEKGRSYSDARKDRKDFDDRLANRYLIRQHLNDQYNDFYRNGRRDGCFIGIGIMIIVIVLYNLYSL